MWKTRDIFDMEKDNLFLKSKAHPIWKRTNQHVKYIKLGEKEKVQESIRNFTTKLNTVIASFNQETPQHDQEKSFLQLLGRILYYNIKEQKAHDDSRYFYHKLQLQTVKSVNSQECLNYDTLAWEALHGQSYRLRPENGQPKNRAPRVHPI